MLRKLKTRLSVATRAIKSRSLYSNHSLTDTDSTDCDSIHSEPSDIYSITDSGIHSPVLFGPAPYEVVAPVSAEPVSDDEYCNTYNIYEEYGLDGTYEPFEFESTQVHVYVYYRVTCTCRYM